MGTKESEPHLVLKYRGTLHKYIQTKMNFLKISSLDVTYRYVVKIENKFKHQNKREFSYANPKQPNYGKNDPNNHPSENNSKPHKKKGNEKVNKDT
jgi:hypothetical protein